MKDLQVYEKALNDFLDGKRKAFSWGIPMAIAIEILLGHC
jgi:hypothetical protein